MPIEYRGTKDFSPEELQRLFLSVNWESGKFPDKLIRAMKNSTQVVSAWDGGKLLLSIRPKTFRKDFHEFY